MSKSQGESTFRGSVLRQIALKANLDYRAFADCFQSARHVEEIKTMTELAQELGVMATPTLFVGNEKLTGVVSLESVKKILGL